MGQKMRQNIPGKSQAMIIFSNILRLTTDILQGRLNNIFFSISISMAMEAFFMNRFTSATIKANVMLYLDHVVFGLNFALLLFLRMTKLIWVYYLLKPRKGKWITK